MNLLDHTMETLTDYGKTIADIEWVGTSDSVIPWDEFERIADIELDPVNIAGISRDMRIVGKDWWMEFDEEDTIEDEPTVFWAYREKPEKPGLVDGVAIQEIDETIGRTTEALSININMSEDEDIDLEDRDEIRIINMEERAYEE
jgi:hypothetical protein